MFGMSAFDQDQPREAHYAIEFLRRAIVPPPPPPRPGLWGRLFPRGQRATAPSTMFPDYHDWADAFLAELGARFADQGWPWTTGPWSWYEPDYRIETTVDGERVVLILVSPPREGEHGSINSEDPLGAPISDAIRVGRISPAADIRLLMSQPDCAVISDAITLQVFAVVHGVLVGRAEVYGLQEHPTGAAWRAAWEAKRQAHTGSVL